MKYLIQWRMTTYYERVPLLEQLRLQPHGLGILRSPLFARSDGVELCAGVGQMVDRKEPSSKRIIYDQDYDLICIDTKNDNNLNFKTMNAIYYNFNGVWTCGEYRI